MTRKRKFVFWLILACLLLMPIALAEIVLRQYGLGHPILFYTNASYRYAPVPNQQQVRLRNAKVTIDSKGLRGPVDWTSPADAKILFIGDSVTWGGTYVDDQQTFAQSTCDRLAAATGKRFICGNAGVNGYGVLNMAERIRYSGVDDASAIVVTLIAQDTLRGLTDAGANFFFSVEPPGPFKGLWEATTFLTWELYNKLRRVGQNNRPEHNLPVAEQGLENLFAVLRATGRPSRKVLIVFSPALDELNGRESALTKRVREVLGRSGFDVLDLHPIVSAAPRGGIYYDNVHLEVGGHRLYAENIAERLKPFFAAQRDISTPAPNAPQR